MNSSACTWMAFGHSLYFCLCSGVTRISNSSSMRAQYCSLAGLLKVFIQFWTQSFIFKISSTSLTSTWILSLSIIKNVQKYWNDSKCFWVVVAAYPFFSLTETVLEKFWINSSRTSVPLKRLDKGSELVTTRSWRTSATICLIPSLVLQSGLFKNSSNFSKSNLCSLGVSRHF